ncbi:hypothetical protein QC764_0086900 [Podospora pseudoanserina]|uniref:Uncharacterized protein n=1 Tax=Podospora pseudoanserina TaxID=2609844 RepID=A0ABR0I7B9_9PEZI|nr:hypothetical protein QC764_0086900 [Podospora pseudoanserina]
MSSMILPEEEERLRRIARIAEQSAAAERKRYEETKAQREKEERKRQERERAAQEREESASLSGMCARDNQFSLLLPGALQSHLGQQIMDPQ